MASDILVLSDATTDYDQFMAQLNASAQVRDTWKGTLTTQTSQTLLGIAASIATFTTGRIYRVYEDAYAETAQSDDAVRAIVQMQGLRMARYLPAALAVTLTSPTSETLAPLTQFTIGGQEYFNRDQIELVAGVPNPNIELSQGSIVSLQMFGKGTALQAFMTDEDSFVVSDRDVQVKINGVTIPKAFGGLWNYKGLPAYSDLTMADGRALMQFGDSQYGSMPGTNDVVSVIYPVTKGAEGNNQTLIGKPITVQGWPLLTGTATANPTGGANDKSITAYKNVASGSFGTFLSSVTKSQYSGAVISYPGIVDAYTQAQREINPQSLRWMNVIRVSGLTESPWTPQQKRDFCDYLQTVTMYAPYFIWVDPIAIDRDVDIEVYVFNSATISEIKAAVEAKIQALFAPRIGLLGTDFFNSDLERCAVIAGNGLVSYTIVNQPTSSMVVGPPESPVINATLLPAGGSLTELLYAYGIATTLTNGEVGPPKNWAYPQVPPPGGYGVKLDWAPITDAQTYTLYGRKSGQMGILATLPASTLTFTDNGSIVPDPVVPPTFSEAPIRYNRLRNLTVTVRYATRQQRLDSTPTRGILS